MLRLLPVDTVYFQLLDRLAAHLTTALDHLHELFADPARADTLVPVIKREEESADSLMHDIRMRLDKTFVTPFDREDIHALGLGIDRVIDLVEDAADSLAMCRLTGIDLPAQRLTGVLVRAGRVIARCVTDLQHPRALLQTVQEVHPLREEGDDVFEGAVSALFDGSPDPVQVIKRKVMYETLDSAIDECASVADVLESVALKHV